MRLAAEWSSEGGKRHICGWWRREGEGLCSQMQSATRNASRKRLLSRLRRHSDSVASTRHKQTDQTSTYATARQTGTSSTVSGMNQVFENVPKISSHDSSFQTWSTSYQPRGIDRDIALTTRLGNRDTCI